MTSPAVRLALVLFVVSVPLIGWAVELGAAFAASHFLGLALIVIAAAVWWRRRPAVPVNAAILSIWALFLVAAVTVVLVQGEADIRMLGESSHAKSVKQLVGLGFGIAVFTALSCLMRWSGGELLVLRTHYWTTVAFAVLALAQYGVAVADLTSPLANFPVRNSTLGMQRPLSLMYGFPRVSLTMVEPSILATYLLSGWAFWLYSLDRPRFFAERARRWFIWSGVVLGCAVVITGSRTAYIVFAVLVVGALMARPARFRRAGLVALTLVIGFLLAGPKHGQDLVATLVPRLPPPASSPAPATSPASPAPLPAAAPNLDQAAKNVEAVVRTQDYSVQQRAASYLVALKVFRERPLLGAGWGTSGFYMERYWPSSFIPLHEGRAAVPTMLSHYATIATETGLVGVLCVAALAVAVCARVRRLARREDARPLAWGLGGSLGGYALGSTATALVVYQTLLVWLLLALALTATMGAAGDASPDERARDVAGELTAERSLPTPTTAPGSHPESEVRR